MQILNKLTSWHVNPIGTPLNCLRKPSVASSMYFHFSWLNTCSKPDCTSSHTPLARCHEVFPKARTTYAVNSIPCPLLKDNT